jgi:hypothetical protein
MASDEALFENRKSVFRRRRRLDVSLVSLTLPNAVFGRVAAILLILWQVTLVSTIVALQTTNR